MRGYRNPWKVVGALSAVGVLVLVLACDELFMPPVQTTVVYRQETAEQLRKLHFTEETIEKSTNVSAVERITNTPLLERGLSLSRDGKKLAFASFDYQVKRGEAGDIWVVNLESGALVRLTSGEMDERNPTWSEDDRFIFFETNSFGGRNIGRIHSEETGGVTQVTTGDGSMMPSYSAAHKKVVFAVHNKSAPQGLICTVNADGRQYTQLKEGTTPSWSPDGKYIVYVRRISRKEMQIWRMNANGSNQTQLTGGNLDAQPSYSPGGKHIVFVSQRGEKKDYNIWFMKADGSSQTQLTTNESAEKYPIFGKTSGTVFFCSNRGGQWDVWKLTTIIR